MKKKILILAVTSVFIAGTIFTSCQTATQKKDSAQNKVQEARVDLNTTKQESNAAVQEAKVDLNQAKQESKDAAQNEKLATADEWKKFRSESELKINANEVRITGLKEKMNKPGQTLDPVYSKKIVALEKQNKDARAKLYAYENNQNNWESFKREFNSDMDGIGTSFKNLTVDNKK